MGALRKLYTCPQNIHGGGGKKGLKPQLFAPDRASAAHLTGAHRLGHRAFNACSWYSPCRWWIIPPSLQLGLTTSRDPVSSG
jgi:hypothetical protein